MPKLLRPKQLAERWDVSEDTVINLIKRRQLPGKKIGGQWRVLNSDAEQYEQIDKGAPQEDEAFKTLLAKYWHVVSAADEVIRRYKESEPASAIGEAIALYSSAKRKRKF